MGWIVGDYKGQPLIHHSGNYLGFASQVSFLPDAGLGIVILTNGGDIGGTYFTLAARFRLLELLFNQPEEYDAVAAQAVQDDIRERADFQAQLRPVDPAAVAPYQGRYTNAALGRRTFRFRTAGSCSSRVDTSPNSRRWWTARGRSPATASSTLRWAVPLG
jgi:hypothetical protein